MSNSIRWMLKLSAVMLVLHGCSTTSAVIANNGAGFTLNNLNRPALAAVVNLDLPAAKRIRVNDAMCMKMPACEKGE